MTIRIWPLGGGWIVALFLGYFCGSLIHYLEIRHLFDVNPHLWAIHSKAFVSGLKWTALSALCGWLAGRTWGGDAG